MLTVACDAVPFSARFLTPSSVSGSACADFSKRISSNREPPLLSGRTDVSSQIQRKYRICLPTKFQDPSKCVAATRAFGSARINHAPIDIDTFTKHGIDKPVPVEQLVKCRMQDNLEFLQWVKKYWDQHYPGGDYDAVGRRKGSGAPPPASGGAPRAASSTARRGGTTPTGAARPRVAAGGASASSATVAALQQEIAAQKEAIAGLEKERDFYFAKLRDIELLLQSAVEADPELEKDEDSLVKHIQTILYSTEVSPPYNPSFFPLWWLTITFSGGLRDPARG